MLAVDLEVLAHVLATLSDVGLQQGEIPLSVLVICDKLPGDLLQLGKTLGETLRA